MEQLLQNLIAGGNPKVTNKSSNFVPGYGLVVLRKLLYDGPPKFEKATFVAEWQVISSEATGDVDASGRPIAPNPPGDIVGYVQHPIPGTLAGKAANGNIKMVTCAIAGLTEDEGDAVRPDGAFEWLHVLGALRDPKTQPGTGIVCRYRALLTATRDDKAKGLPKHAWHTFAKFETVAQSEEQVAKFAKLISEGKKITPADFDQPIA